MLDKFARFLYQHRRLVVIVSLILLAVGGTFGIGVFSSLKGGGLTDPRSEANREAAEVARQFPKSRISILLVLQSDTATVDQPAFRTDANRILQTVRNEPGVVTVLDYYGTKDTHFLSRDHRQTYAVIALKGGHDAQSETYLRLRKAIPATSLRVIFGGPFVADYEIDHQVQKDLPAAESLSFPILLVLLVFIFRSVIAALLPLFIGAVTILVAFALARVMTNFVDMSVFAANIISLLGLGLAIDYSLLFVSRFRDELAEGKDVPDALAKTLSTAGESIFFSGCTVSLSLLGVLAFPENFLRSMGIGGALATVVALITSLTVLPALLALLGPRVNLWAIPLPHRPKTARSTEEGFWFRFSHWVMRHAVLVIVLTLGLLFFLGIPFLHTRFANPGSESLPDTFQSRLSAEALQRDFTATSAPIEAIVTLPAPPTNPDQLNNMLAYVARLRKLPGATNVTSLVSLDSRIASSQYLFFYSFGDPSQIAQAKQHFVSGNSTIVTVDYKGGSQSPEAQKLVTAIRAVEPPKGGTVLVGGDTAELVDRQASLRNRLPIAGGIIVASTFLLLCFMLHSLAVPTKAVLLNILSLAASFGLMTWIFQDGNLSGLLNFRSSGALDVTLPVLIFALAFGLSTDYEVFLVSRIREEYHRTDDNTEAVAHGVEKTGQIITSAALLLIVVVAAFGASKILPMKEIGVGLAIAIFIDATIVRMLLVPATMRVFGRWNWWPGG